MFDNKNKENIEDFVLQNYKYFVIGKMFGLVVHQFNQPLTVVTYSLSQLQFFYDNKMLTQELFCENVKQAEDTVLNVSEILTKLSIFLSSKSANEEIYINDLFKNLQFLVNFILKKFEIDFECTKNIQLNIDKNKFLLLFLDIIRVVYGVFKIDKTKIIASIEDTILQYQIFFDIKLEQNHIKNIENELQMLSLILKNDYNSILNINYDNNLLSLVFDTKY